MSNEIKKQKQKMLEKFDKFMQQNKEIEPETIKKMFPDDEELYKKVEELKKSKRKKRIFKKKNKMMKSTKSSKIWLKIV